MDFGSLVSDCAGGRQLYCDAWQDFGTFFPTKKETTIMMQILNTIILGLWN